MVLPMKNLTMTTESTYPDIIEFLKRAKDESELEFLVAKVRSEGMRVFGDGFTIRVDRSSMSKGLDRAFLYVPDWDDPDVTAQVSLSTDLAIHRADRRGECDHLGGNR